MRAKFRVREMCVVVDRGIVSEATLQALERMDPPVHYIVGVRMRRTRGRRGRAQEPSPLAEVTPSAGTRRTPRRSRSRKLKSRAAVTSSVSTRRSGERTPRTTQPSSRPCASNCAVTTIVSLKQRLSKVPQNRGSRPLCHRRNAVAQEERYHGLFVLRTDTDHDRKASPAFTKCFDRRGHLSHGQVHPRNPPIFHKCHETIRVTSSVASSPSA